MRLLVQVRSLIRNIKIPFEFVILINGRYKVQDLQQMPKRCRTVVMSDYIRKWVTFTFKRMLNPIPTESRASLTTLINEINGSLTIFTKEINTSLSTLMKEINGSLTTSTK
ncbi:hypothetical protein Trydic_g21462 [Trypoxylus dichotomus]